MSVDVVTLGCRLNTFESEVMRSHAIRAGAHDRDRDCIIVNTCAVTREAERQARQTIRKLKREKPDARIVVTGCAAQLNPGQFADMDEVSQVLGNEEKLAPDFLDRDEIPVRVSDIMAVSETAPHLVAGFEERTRAFVQVQQGCDHRCTFCIIPFARGRNRSVGLGALVDQVQLLVDGGYREVVLTGVDICSYGADLPGQPRLGATVRRLLDLVPGLQRLRLSSLDPAAMDDDLFQLLADDDRFQPHLHLSLQAADDMVLKRMKRRHSRDDAARVIDRARSYRADVVFGADIIAGFPTETDAMFQNTLRFIDEYDLIHCHVFPYSEREGTPAARMPAVEKAVRKARAAALREAGARRLKAWLASRVGETEVVLAETETRGRTSHFANVHWSGRAKAGELVEVRITGETGDHLTGDLVWGT
ncbi:MAG: tRNA (N(6)-L-threonylcarbamoyladenosine(37)-C(2))-methylthiotransferase MtaB [Magnetovibrionaceae bacterium]